MKHEYFTEEPVLELKEGIRVTAETALTYNSRSVEQVLKDLTLKTRLEESGSGGRNSYKSETSLTLFLNPGDILLFDKDRGYYLPRYPVCAVADAVEAVLALEQMARKEEGHVCGE